MSAKPQAGGDSPSCTGTASLEQQHKSRTEYAGRRMAAALKRMGDVSLSSREWELALRWATAWGMAVRTGPRCRCPGCATRIEARGLDKSARRFSRG